MTKRSGKYLFALAVCSTAGIVGCGGGDTTGGTGSNTGTAGVAATAGVNGGVAGVNGTAGTTAGTMNVGTAGTMSTAGTNGTAGTTAGTGTGCDPTTMQCDDACRDTAEGVYAMKVELDVWWRDEENVMNGMGSELADPGRGKINIYFRGEITDIDDTTKMGKGVMHPCGTELPPFVASASCAAIQIKFPDAMWDNAAVPDYETTGMTTGFSVGDILTVTKTMGFLGLNLDAGAAFPDNTDTATLECDNGAKKGTLWTDGQAPTLAQAPCFPDQDGDGNPGITVNFVNDKSKIAGPGYGCPDPNSTGMDFTFNGAPLGLLSILPGPTTGAQKGWIGLQTELGGSGKIKDGCMSGVGSAEAGAGLPSRVLHCIQNGGGQCTQADSGFLDANTPNYHILKAGEKPPAEWKFAGALNGARDSKLNRGASLGPRSSVIRLGDPGTPVTCGMIRSAQFLPFE